MWCRFQLRCLLGQPLTVAAGGVVTGELRLVAHKRQSYDVHLTLSAPPLLPGDSPQTVLARWLLQNPDTLWQEQETTDPSTDANNVCTKNCTFSGAAVLLKLVSASQASSKLDLKEPYYRQSACPDYAMLCHVLSS